MTNKKMRFFKVLEEETETYKIIVLGDKETEGTAFAIATIIFKEIEK